MNTRRIAPSHQQWNPLPYMRNAVDFLRSHYSAGLPLKPGGRKTSITLKAFDLLRQEGKARTMLVVAPLRVARQVWAQEGAKWTDFRHLTFAHVTGDAKTRVRALKSGADVYLINYENLPWLAKQYFGRPLPFDVVVFDELTKMQNPQAERCKAIRPRLKGVRYRWGLTGSLFAKGHMSIFGQQLILDDGAALGRYITHYRDTYFSVGFNGFDYDLIPGAEKRIVEKLAPYWFPMDDKDYAQLPPLVDVPHIATMEPQQRQLYERMKRDALIQIDAETITAANAGAVYSKLAQLANGAIYRDGHTSRDEFEKVHDLKLDMLEELLDELDGEPLMVGYEFQHDIVRIQERFAKRFGGQVPYLGAGTTARQEDEWVAAWNRRDLPLLLAHPQSAGHGLNMQEGQAYNVAWFSVTWDWELYDQFIRRVRRSGNEQARIFNHLLIIKGTIDEDKLSSVSEKDFTERRLLSALNNQIFSENRSDEMVAKLSRPGAATEKAQEAPRTSQAREERDEPQTAGGGGSAPAGWGGVGGGDQTADQRQRIQEKIAPDRSGEARSAFSGGVADQAQRMAEEYGDVQTGTATGANGWGQVSQQEPEATSSPKTTAGGWGQAPADTTEETKPKRTRSTKATAPEPASDIAALRAQVLTAVVRSSPEDATVEDIVDISRELMEFVVNG